jgi:hypothetical protein
MRKRDDYTIETIYSEATSDYYSVVYRHGTIVAHVTENYVFESEAIEAANHFIGKETQWDYNHIKSFVNDGTLTQLTGLKQWENLQAVAEAWTNYCSDNNTEFWDLWENAFDCWQAFQRSGWDDYPQYEPGMIVEFNHVFQGKSINAIARIEAIENCDRHCRYLQKYKVKPIPEYQHGICLTPAISQETIDIYEIERILGEFCSIDKQLDIFEDVNTEDNSMLIVNSDLNDWNHAPTTAIAVEAEETVEDLLSEVGLGNLAPTIEEPKPVSTAPGLPLFGHTSFESSYLVEDYPYGRQLRCRKAIWIETATQGQAKGKMRIVYRTTNPKKSGEVWNKPHLGQYKDLILLYLDDTTGYVDYTICTSSHSLDEIAAWKAQWYSLLDDHYKKLIDDIEKVAIAWSRIKWKITPTEEAVTDEKPALDVPVVEEIKQAVSRAEQALEIPAIATVKSSRTGNTLEIKQKILSQTNIYLTWENHSVFVQLQKDDRYRLSYLCATDQGVAESKPESKRTYESLKQAVRVAQEHLINCEAEAIAPTEEPSKLATEATNNWYFASAKQREEAEKIRQYYFKISNSSQYDASFRAYGSMCLAVGYLRLTKPIVQPSSLPVDDIKRLKKEAQKIWDLVQELNASLAPETPAITQVCAASAIATPQEIAPIPVTPKPVELEPSKIRYRIREDAMLKAVTDPVLVERMYKAVASNDPELASKLFIVEIVTAEVAPIEEVQPPQVVEEPATEATPESDQIEIVAESEPVEEPAIEAEVTPELDQVEIVAEATPEPVEEPTTEVTPEPDQTEIVAEVAPEVEAIAEEPVQSESPFNISINQDAILDAIADPDMVDRLYRAIAASDPELAAMLFEGQPEDPTPTPQPPAPPRERKPARSRSQRDTSYETLYPSLLSMQADKDAKMSMADIAAKYNLGVATVQEELPSFCFMRASVAKFDQIMNAWQQEIITWGTINQTCKKIGKTHPKAAQLIERVLLGHMSLKDAIASKSQAA